MTAPPTSYQPVSHTLAGKCFEDALIICGELGKPLLWVLSLETPAIPSLILLEAWVIAVETRPTCISMPATCSAAHTARPGDRWSYPLI